MTNTPLSTKTIWLRGAAVTGIATVINVLVATVSAIAVDASPTFLALTPGPVAFLTIVLMAAGTLTYAILNRFGSRVDRWFAVIAIVVALLSLAAPILLAVDPSQAPERLGQASTASASALVPLHLIPAAALLIALRWRTAHTSTDG
ncbi:MAG: DUF6069 family protein [Actinomycetota bacterium]